MSSPALPPTMWSIAEHFPLIVTNTKGKYMNKLSRTILSTAIASTLVACAGLQFGKLSDAEQANMQQLMASVPEPLRHTASRLFEEGERNAVLNFQSLGLKAMEQSQFALAERSFDEALRRIEAIYANNEHAKKAKSLWTEERVKDFKGEPYERAMAYYYRGLLYLRAGDYQNARASFLQADYQDTISEREEFSGDFAVMTYLAGWSSMCDGDKVRAEDLLRNALSKAPALAAIPMNSQFLAVIDAGAGPVKVGTGKHRELLSFEESPAAVDQVVGLAPPTLVVASNDAQVASGIPGSHATALYSTHFTSLVKAGDVVYQATTRGGRPIQGILDGKAQFKDNAKAAGEAALAVGQTTALAGLYSDNADMAGVGAVIGLFGAIASLASDAAKPAADTRHWGNLPRDMYLVGGEFPPPDNASLKAQVANQTAGNTVPLSYWGKKGSCSVAWGKTRTGADSNDARKVETSARPADKQFRATLAEIFRRAD